MAEISIDQFHTIEIRVGTILVAEKVPDAEKLIRLMVDVGDEGGPRQIVSGIAGTYPDPSVLVGKQTTFVTNLAPRMLRGLESNGMLFAASDAEGLVLLNPERKIVPGSSAG